MFVTILEAPIIESQIVLGLDYYWNLHDLMTYANYHDDYAEIGMM